MTRFAVTAIVIVKLLTLDRLRAKNKVCYKNWLPTTGESLLQETYITEAIAEKFSWGNGGKRKKKVGLHLELKQN